MGSTKPTYERHRPPAVYVVPVKVLTVEQLKVVDIDVAHWVAGMEEALRGR